MPASRRLLPTLATLLTAATLASVAHAGTRAEIAPAPRTADRDPPRTSARTPVGPRATPPDPEPDAAATTASARKRAHGSGAAPPPRRPTARERPTRAPDPKDTAPSSAPVPKDTPSRPAPVPKDTPSRPAPVPKDTPLRPAPVPKDTPSRPAPVPKDTHARAVAGARLPAAEPARPRHPLRPRREPLLARHPAASCALDPHEAVGLGQHGRARDSLREFYWSDMARFFESSVDLAEPVPNQVRDPAFLPADAVLRELPAALRAPLAAVAASRVVDRLGEREFNKVSKLLASLSPAQVASLLRADAPTLRGYVWTWLATTRTGGCHLGHLDLDFIEAAVADRSVAVEHGDDLVYRSLGDYALAARARLATLDPARFDAFLTRLTTAGEVDPLVRATAHGVLLRRAHWETLELGLRDASPPVRAATAAAAIEMNRDKVEPALIEHAAADPADLVTELIVGALLGVHDPHNHGRPQLRGPLANTRDDRLVAAVARWRGHGDPLEPLPGPRHPLRLHAAPVPEDMSSEPAPPTTIRPAPVPADSPAAPVLQDSPSVPVPADSPHTPVPQDSPRAPVPQDSPSAAADPPEPSLPGVLDEPGEQLPLRPR